MKKLWFKRKYYGWGWRPVSWQGWLVVIVYVIGLTRIFRYADSDSHSTTDLLTRATLPFIVLTSILIFICYKTGEKPKWQWGNKPIDKDR